MFLSMISKCFIVGVSLAMFVAGIQAEQGEVELECPPNFDPSVGLG